MKILTEFLILLFQLKYSHVHHFFNVVTCLVCTNDSDFFVLVELASLLLIEPPHTLQSLLQTLYLLLLLGLVLLMLCQLAPQL